VLKCPATSCSLRPGHPQIGCFTLAVPTENTVLVKLICCQPKGMTAIACAVSFFAG